MIETNKYKLENIEVEGICTSDYPDFCDAFISYAELYDVALTDKDLDLINEDQEFVYECVLKQLY